MRKNGKDKLSPLVLIGANLIPLAGVFFFGWGVTFIVLLYWIENLIAGFYNILKMAILKTEQAANNLNKLFIIPFFCLHYGGFCAVHGVFLTTFFKIGSGSSPLDSGSVWWGPFVFLQILFSVIAKLWASKPPEMIWAVIGLFISHGVSFVENYILGLEYRTSAMKELMHKPYQRIIVMHIAIIFGGIFVMKLNSPMPLMIILILLKIFFDQYLHRKSHSRIKETNREVPGSNEKNKHETETSQTE
jgi:hypothetical protein